MNFFGTFLKKRATGEADQRPSQKKRRSDGHKNLIAAGVAAERHFNAVAAKNVARDDDDDETDETLKRIIGAVDGVPSAGKWRREVSSLVTVSGKTYRLFMRRVLFAGRCFDCNKNFKSMRHCFIGQTSNKLKDEASVMDSTLRLKKFDLLKRSFDESFGSVCSESLFVFPSETDLESPKKISRISQKHNFPMVDTLLRDEAFRPYFEPRAFQNFFSEPFVVTSRHKNMPGAEGGKREAVWTESNESHGARRALYNAGIAKLDEDSKRRAVASALAESYTKFKSKTHCSKACERDVKNHKMASLPKVSACEHCKYVRKELKKKYVDMMDATVSGIVNDLFHKREGPFKGCPKDLSEIGDRYVDDLCRVQRIRESTQA